MFSNGKILARLVPVVIGLGAAGAAYGASDSSSNRDDPVRCEIKVAEKGSMISLDGVVYSDTAIDGTYRFQIASAGGSGGSNIRQGGGFSAAAGDEVTLGRVMVSGYGASYDASLQVTLDGVTYQCSERVGGNI